MLCRKHSVVPLRIEDGVLLLAMADPANVFAVDDMRTTLREQGMVVDVKTAVATKADVVAAIDRYYRDDDQLDDLQTALEAEDDDEDLANLKEVVEDAPIVKYVNLLITQAIQDRASDIHLEPSEYALNVRYRIDGVLHDVMTSPKNIQAA